MARPPKLTPAEAKINLKNHKAALKEHSLVGKALVKELDDAKKANAKAAAELTKTLEAAQKAFDKKNAAWAKGHEKLTELIGKCEAVLAPEAPM